MVVTILNFYSFHYVSVYKLKSFNTKQQRDDFSFKKLHKNLFATLLICYFLYLNKNILSKEWYPAYLAGTRSVDMIW